MENLTLKIAIPYEEVRKMVVRMNGEIWSDEQIKQYFSKRKTIETNREELREMDEEAFDVFTALSVALIEKRKKDTTKRIVLDFDGYETKKVESLKFKKAKK